LLDAHNTIHAWRGRASTVTHALNARQVHKKLQKQANNEDPVARAERKRRNKEQARKDQERREQKERAREILEQQLAAKPVAITQRFAVAGASSSPVAGSEGDASGAGSAVAAVEDPPV
jgi:uncharacterized protein with ATP-grasp and redox domains